MVKIVNADIIEWAKNYRGPKFHALFADVPYEISFMNKSWDSSGIAFNPETWAALAEHLLPGAFLFVFAGTLNDDLISVAMRQAGLRKFHKTLAWGTGQGFPKASRIDTAIDRAAGAIRSDIGKNNNHRTLKKELVYCGQPHTGNGRITAPATPLAKTWAGHRYGLQVIKPAAETILIFQKPYDGKPVDSITKNGSGALWVDGARIITNENRSRNNNARTNGTSYVVQKINRFINPGGIGRWPANLILLHSSDDNGTCSPECVVRELDEQSGESVSTNHNRGMKRKGWFMPSPNTESNRGINDTGGASRFFFNAGWNHEAAEQISHAAAVRYVAKAARNERNRNVEEFYWRKSKKSSVGFDRITFADWRKLKPEDRAQGNIHSTVKPISLCKYLATLLLPPAEYAPRRILVPFAGVASEAIGAMLAGWEEVTAIEKETKYCDIGRARVKYWQNHTEPIAKKSKPQKVSAPQIAELFPEYE